MTLENFWYGNVAICAAEERDEKENEVRRISGVASTGIVDRAGTIVEQKSLQKAAKRYDKNNGKIYYNHNWSWGIGTRESIESDGERLYFKGRLAKNLPFPVRAGTFGLTVVMMNTDDLWSSIQQGVTSSLSIGFLADSEEGELDEKTGKRGPTILRVTDLLEVSIVSIPANPQAEFSITKAMHDPVFNTFLDSVGKAQIEDAVSRHLEGRDLWGLEETEEANASAGHGDGAAYDQWAQLWEEMGKCLLPLKTSVLDKHR